MAETTVANSLSGLIPRGSLGLKLLLVCFLVLLMGVPLMLLGAIQSERQGRAREVTEEIGAQAGGAQIVYGPMLLVPYQRQVETTDDQGRALRRTERGNYVIFAENGEANAALAVTERRRGIYRAAMYTATTDFTASFAPSAALANVSEAYRFNWAEARVFMFVHDSNAIQEAIELRFSDADSVALEPMSQLNATAPAKVHPRSGSFSSPTFVEPALLQALGAPAPLTGAPRNFTVSTQLVLTGAQSFRLAAFAQNTQARIRGDRSDASVHGQFQSNQTMIAGRAEDAKAPDAPVDRFVASWSVPYVRRGVEKAADLASFDIGAVADKDMAVSFVAVDDIYVGVARAVRYGIMFIGIVFLATLIFEAVSGKKAHPAQYVLVGLAQCVFYLLLLSITEVIGFTLAFIIAAGATVALLAFYASASFHSAAVGWRALLGLALLYGAMYVLMTLEDYALLAGSVVAFTVIAASMIATRGIDWYGRGPRQGEAGTG